MIITTARTIYDVKMVGGLFEVKVLEGTSAGSSRTGDTISGTKMGAKFTLSNKGQLVIQSTTVIKTEGML